MACPQVGDEVIKNPATWEPHAFDQLGRGDGTGVIIAIIDPYTVDVRWPNGHYHEQVIGLIFSS